jgi:hypothetical protein
MYRDYVSLNGQYGSSRPAASVTVQSSMRPAAQRYVRVLTVRAHCPSFRVTTI